jgi:hypothetical protein
MIVNISTGSYFFPLEHFHRVRYLSDETTARALILCCHTKLSSVHDDYASTECLCLILLMFVVHKLKLLNKTIMFRLRTLQSAECNELMIWVWFINLC